MKILFLCTGNSCRSQMAEGWSRHLLGGSIEAFSAGIQPKDVDSIAVRVMAEAGVDISQQHAKSLSVFLGKDFDYIITLCDSARENCPVFPGYSKTMHVGFEDPAQLAAKITDKEAQLEVYRRVRDEIKRFVERLPENLPPL